MYHISTRVYDCAMKNTQNALPELLLHGTPVRIQVTPCIATTTLISGPQRVNTSGSIGLAEIHGRQINLVTNPFPRRKKAEAADLDELNN